MGETRADTPPGRWCEKHGCGFSRLTRTTPDGHTFAVSGCPECLDNPETVEAFDELVKAVHKMERARPEPTGEN